jgi:hypothetical protein
MSLQKAWAPGSATLRFAAPVLRSRPFRALRLSPLLEGPPKALRSFEHAQSVFALSSANTPKMDRVSDAPGGTNTATLPLREFARTIPPSPRRPMNSVPSAVDVRLSGNARRPGSAIDCASAVAACGDTAGESTATAIATRATHRLNLTLESTTIDVSVYDTVGFLTRRG